MIGEIIHFDDAEQQGTIRDEKGGEHAFDLVGWRGRGLPGPGLAVDFELRDGRAVQVFNARIKQQKARRVVSMPPESEAGEAPEAQGRRRQAGNAQALVARRAGHRGTSTGRVVDLAPRPHLGYIRLLLSSLG